MMDVLGNDTEHFFLLPVALIFQNESDPKERMEYGSDAATVAAAAADVVGNRSGESWRAGEVASDEPRRLERMGDVIRKELKWTFILHTYGFGCLFFILAFYTFFSILNIRSFISSRPFMSTINGFLCLLGASRAASLFIDPYNLKENMPRLFGQVLWDLGFPSIISAFSLVQLAFLQFTQFRVGPEGLRRKSCLSLVVTAHFLLTIAMDIVVASHENLMIAKHVVHYVFLTWGVFLCSNFLYGGYKIMSMIKRFPEGLKRGDLPDTGYKGMTQLAMSAPHNNLAGSVTAALLPTLCAPKIHQQDNVNLSSVGFKTDRNSRILESESIPMLEELMGSSGDEISPNPLVRASSFQNQTRNSQKFTLKPKLYFKSVSDDPKDDELSQRQRAPKDQKDHSAKGASVKAKEFGVKSANGILKSKENFAASQSVPVYKRKLEQRTCFENENFCFANEKKALPISADDGPSPKAGCETPGAEATEGEGEKSHKTLRKLMSEISKDLNEMHILRDDKTEKSEEMVGVHKSSKKTHDDEREVDTQNKSEVTKSRGARAVFASAEKRKEFCEGANRANDRSEPSAPETAAAGRDASTGSSVLKELANFEEMLDVPQKIRGRKKVKTLSWKKKPETEEEKATRECLLLREQSADAALKSALNHAATMQKAPSSAGCDEDFEKVRKSKMEWVLNITYITAMWGLMLCLSYMGKLYSPFGLPEPRRTVSRLNSTHSSRHGTPTEPTDGGVPFSSWPWLWFQTFCRALELAMGCAMANITRQPTANHRYSRSLTFRHGDTFYNI